MKLTLFLLFILLSCSHEPRLEANKKITLEKDRKWFKDLLPYFKNPNLEKIFTTIKSIEVTNDICDPGQIACSRLFAPYTVYVTKSFFSMKQSMRISTLIHEGAHHFYRYYAHTKCLNGEYNCDDSLSSAYGSEILFYNELIGLYPENNDYKKELALIQNNLTSR